MRRNPLSHPTIRHTTCRFVTYSVVLLTRSASDMIQNDATHTQRLAPPDERPIPPPHRSEEVPTRDHPPRLTCPHPTPNPNASPKFSFLTRRPPLVGVQLCDFGLARSLGKAPAASTSPGGGSSGAAGAGGVAPDVEDGDSGGEVKLTEYVVTRWWRAPEVTRKRKRVCVRK